MLYPAILKVPDFVAGLKVREKNRALSVCARRSLLVSAEASNISLEHLKKGEFGEPLPCEGVYWSITHKSKYVAGVAARFPVGIDIEEIKPVRLSLFRKICSDEESEFFDNIYEKETVFFRVFTAKEAVLKSRGRGISHLSYVKVAKVPDSESMLLFYNEFNGENRGYYCVKNFYYKEHVLSIATASEEYNKLNCSVLLY
ncbi:conserved hypothetical protein [Desulfamplus magnetovallimortis]|uniref:4'-phosphopantetheinyl transferase domain-containing protein n=1 Tax=Desulfamplus magnetovallimortis TaxID=1246637 RepID=A0A1W1H991_9BACT|nr:4'-phosphopantetheinyl transferase superfamily protein [Desulfamplus magnetovallimortis]SLM29041.1 conserved hypothetical protein [Desulfamplus magnetovallimortis]